MYRMKVAQTHRINESYNGNGNYLELEPDINNWLEQKNIGVDDLIRVTYHYDKIYSGYPAPNDYRGSGYAIIYYLKDTSNELDASKPRHLAGTL